MEKTQGIFTRIATQAVCWSGKPGTFVLAFAVIVVWAVSGPMFGYSDTWQLVINTGTSVTTFLMVFLIQNSQNRDTKALQIKLDELIRATEGAHTALLDLEELEEAEIDKIRKQYEKIASEGRERIRRGEVDTDVPQLTLQQ